MDDEDTMLRVIAQTLRVNAITDRYTYKEEGYETNSDAE